MRKIVLILGLLAGWLVWPIAHAFEEGRHYYEVPFRQPVETGQQIEVREVFWYGCPHCYKLEPALNGWRQKGMPKNAAFRRLPGIREGWVVHARLYFTLEKLGVVEKHHGAIFDAIHKDGIALDSEDQVAAFLVKRGVDEKKFRQTWNSFAVRYKLERALQYNREAAIAGVPSFVVDGRYVTSVHLAGGEEQVFRLLEALIARAARERNQRQKK